MNQPLDNFFREKLGQAHKPAPLSAWDRIDAGLDGKQRKGMWLKVAASVLIVAAGSFILWPAEKTSHMPVATAPSKENAPKHTPPQIAPTPVVTAPAPAPAVATTAVPSSQPSVRKTKRPAPQPTAVPEPLPVQQEVAYQEQARQHNDDAPGYEQVPLLKPAPASANVVLADAAALEETDGSITLVYSANEVDEKYLDKEALAKATSAQKKPSTFRKLLEKAYDLKNNQDPLGGLRQKKNEILALNFKNEKRSQNK
jgi:hypothetical protein